MKKLVSIFSPRKVIVWVCVLVFAFTVPALNRPALSQTLGIVTMISVDKEDDKIIAVATLLSPGQEKQPNYNNFTGEGRTLAEAVDSISLAVGKDIGFAQCEIMALGDNICEDSIMKTLDYMVRTKKVGENAILINFSGDVQDFAESITKMNLEKSLKLSDIINFDKRYILTQDSNIEGFYKAYFSDLSLGFVPKIKLESTGSGNAIEVAAGGASGSSGPQNTNPEAGQEEKKYIITDGSSVVFKNGKKYFDLTPEDVDKINIFANDSQKGSITIDHVTDHLYDDAKVVLDVVSKSIKLKPIFEQDKPVMQVDLDLKVFIDEVVQKNPTDKFLVREQLFLTDTDIEKVKEKVVEDMEGAVYLCRENKMDLLKVYQTFYRRKYKQFMQYLNTTSKETFLDGVEFKYKVKVSNEF